MTLKTPFKLLFALVSVGVLVKIGDYYYKNRYGFCHDRQAYISDREYEDMAIRFVLLDQARERKASGNEDKLAQADEIKYRDSDHFRAVNPNCCNVLPYKSGESFNLLWLGPLMGSFGPHVRVRFRQYRSDTRLYNYHIVRMQACGVVGDWVRARSGTGPKVAPEALKE